MIKGNFTPLGNVRTRGRELRTRMQSGGSCARHLPFSVVLASVLVYAPEPAYLNLVRFFQSLHGRSCLPVFAPEPCGVRCASGPFLLGNLACARAA